MIAKYHDQIEVLNKYFKKKNDEQWVRSQNSKKIN
jgi:hypothetical protein